THGAWSTSGSGGSTVPSGAKTPTASDWRANSGHGRSGCALGKGTKPRSPPAVAIQGTRRRSGGAPAVPCVWQATEGGERSGRGATGAGPDDARASDGAA